MGGGGASQQQIKDLQRDLRRLGYLRSGIDGVLGNGTARAIKGLQHDLLTNNGSSRAGDGSAPVRMIDFNRGVTAETGEADQALVESISALLDDSRIPALPSTANPAAENQRILSLVRALPPAVPTSFLLAILTQESGLKHFHEPGSSDDDTFITVGLDTGKVEDQQEHIIKSRGYGVGQYTLFHHPPGAGEVADFMMDPGKNVQRASRELRDKFDHFVNSPGSTADDRIAEIGPVPLRECKFAKSDPRFLTDCKQCLADAGFQDLVAGITPLFPGSPKTYEATSLRSNFTRYNAVPVRRAIGCDWPYAARRYNGGGMDSYHYQAQVLLNLKNL